MHIYIIKYRAIIRVSYIICMLLVRSLNVKLRMNYV